MDTRAWRWFLGLMIFVMLQLGAVMPAGADGGASNSEWTAGRQDAAVNTASNASFDHRLPPVLPGEEVRDGRATSKVWSTSGPVPVDTTASPYMQGNSETGRKVDSSAGLPSGVGVIVDQRKTD